MPRARFGFAWMDMDEWDLTDCWKRSAPRRGGKRSEDPDGNEIATLRLKFVQSPVAMA